MHESDKIDNIWQLKADPGTTEGLHQTYTNYERDVVTTKYVMTSEKSFSFEKCQIGVD